MWIEEILGCFGIYVFVASCDDGAPEKAAAFDCGSGLSVFRGDLPALASGGG